MLCSSCCWLLRSATASRLVSILAAQRTCDGSMARTCDTQRCSRMPPRQSMERGGGASEASPSVEPRTRGAHSQPHSVWPLKMSKPGLWLTVPHDAYTVRPQRCPCSLGVAATRTDGISSAERPQPTRALIARTYTPSYPDASP